MLSSERHQATRRSRISRQRRPSSSDLGLRSSNRRARPLAWEWSRCSPSVPSSRTIVRSVRIGILPLLNGSSEAGPWIRQSRCSDARRSPRSNSYRIYRPYRRSVTSKSNRCPSTWLPEFFSGLAPFQSSVRRQAMWPWIYCPSASGIRRHLRGSTDSMFLHDGRAKRPTCCRFPGVVLCRTWIAHSCLKPVDWCHHPTSLARARRCSTRQVH